MKHGKNQCKFLKNGGQGGVKKSEAHDEVSLGFFKFVYSAYLHILCAALRAIPRPLTL